jgi:hypothetical protein
MLPQTSYKELLSFSPVYQKLTEGMQMMILRAKGEDRDKYERIFKIEADGIAAAKIDLLKRNNVVVKDFSSTVVKIHTGKRKADESAAASRDAKTGDKLLQKLDNI